MHKPLAFACVLLLSAGCTAVRSPILTAHSDADWTTSAAQYRGQSGEHVRFLCPPNPSRSSVGTVWGAEVYTDDSAVCAAAVHAGAISFARGGAVTIEVRPGQSSYRGTDWNGVVSRDYGAWDGSFVVLGR